jgi:transketolase
MPSWELFENQDKAYKETVLPKRIKARLAVEAAASLGWERYVGLEGMTICLDHFGASAPYKTIFEKFGLTVDNVVKQAKSLLPAVKKVKPKTKKNTTKSNSRKPARRK